MIAPAVSGLFIALLLVPGGSRSPLPVSPPEYAPIHESAYEDLQRVRNLQTTGKSEIGTRLARSATLSGVVRFSISIYPPSNSGLHPTSGKVASREAILKGVQDGLRLWEKATNRGTRFLLSSEDQASIRLEFRESVRFETEEVSGLADWERDPFRGEQTLQANISIRTCHPAGCPMSSAMIQHVVAHEIGHLYGLDDIETSGSIMSQLDFRNPVTRISRAELLAVGKLKRDFDQALLKRL